MKFTMKWCGIVSLVSLLVLVEAQERDPRTAAECDPSTCRLPTCRCSNVDIPGGLAARDTPQFVLLTFDDAVNVQNIDTYRSLLYRRTNRNNCPVGTTFYVSHEYTDYAMVNELYNNDLEIALHSITHQSPQEYWRDANVTVLHREFADQIRLMSHFANIPPTALRGIRSPFLQMAGDRTFQMLANASLTYDSSWTSVTYNNPGLWPYTLHYRSVQDCQIPPCPTSSIPGPWVSPITTWLDLRDIACGMVDTCVYVPSLNNEEEWFQFIVRNFERHYLGNRSPFGFYVHEWYISLNPAVGRALRRFLDLVNNLNDAFMVNTNDVIEWARNPVPINEYVRQPCRRNTPTTCARRTCSSLPSDHNDMRYYMQVCSPTCPNRYPWINNPLGN